MPDIGIMFRLNDTSADPASQYEAGLRLIEHAEAIGLDSAWITSHHFRSDKGTISSPLLFLTAAGQRTSRIRLGAAVVLLTLEEPVRVAEDAVVANLLSGDRLELGLGSGLEPWPFPGFGIDWEARHEVFDAKLARLRAAFAGADLGGGRQLYPPPGPLRRRVWRIATNPAAATDIARHGENLLLGSSKKLTAAQNKANRAAAIDAFREHARPCQRILASRSIFVRPDAAVARREFVAATPAGTPQEYKTAALVGHPAEVRARLEEDTEIPLVDDFLIQTIPAHLTRGQWQGSLALAAHEIFPPGSPLRATARGIPQLHGTPA
ncbi:LLM class flavin-dependent oxidoreductase [Phytohabitans kaempferiae]|uniref:LLM class flavin-dependent oxidoreductase n=1 Tax=Phytohabitans kaempferiae TaxID=1620943 RepID=A0ABV6MHM6_9ACTN